MNKINNLDAERAMLAAIMTDYAKIKPALSELTAEHFSEPEHIEVFKAMTRAIEAGMIPDRPTVYEYSSPESKKNGMVKLLETLYFTAETIEHPENTIATLKKNKLKRDYARILMNAVEQIADGMEPPAVVDTVLTETKKMDTRKAEVIDMGSMYIEVMQDIERISKGKNLGLHVGFHELDGWIGGFQPGELVVVCGRPGTGKSQLAFQFATNVSRHGKRSFIASLEMSAKQLFIRYLSNKTEIDKRKIRRAQLSETEMAYLLKTMDEYKENILIDDSGKPRINHIVAQARLTHAKTPLDMMIVDHLQLVSTDMRNAGRVTELDEITRQLKLLAKELNIPIFVLSQLSRKCEERPNKRPMQSDLRESGGIEQNADIVIGIYHDSMYNPVIPHDFKCEVLILKNREEGTGTVHMMFHPEIVKFIDGAPEHGKF